MENTKTTTMKTPTVKQKLGRDSERGALWTRESKTGEEYMTGEVTVDGKKIEIVVYRNGYKEEDRHPDFRIYERQPMESQVAEVKKAATSLKTPLNTSRKEQTTPIAEVEYPA